MRSSLTLFLDPLIGLYILTYALRLAMQWVRADYRNPIVQFVLKVTNPLVLPLRRVLPPVYKIDTATLVIYVILCWAGISLLASLECFLMPDFGSLFALGLLYGARLILSTYTFIVLGYVLLSWIVAGGYNPNIAMLYGMLGELARPVMAPLQKIIPPIGGLDLSPIFLLIGMQALASMLYSPAIRLVAGYNCNLGPIL